MAIIVRDVSDEDIPRSIAIGNAAYADNPLSPILFPGPFSEEYQSKRAPEMVELRKNDPTCHFIQAYDEETKQMVAFAKWHIYSTSEAAQTARRPSRTFGAGTNPEACEAFFGSLAVRKKEHVGQSPHLYLHMLHTDPAFQGRGAGGMLIKWGTRKADELGLRTYLEASPKGHPVYERHGFRDVEVFDFDLAPFGGPGIYKEPLMIREPVASK
ncbi:acyl-CoA N-acyltransferase [Phaeosphaeria sp. MPI-PUGE-AT-0046c]|nr:acyl-CoA N-acyltransferase [Phaeosphaeria sp. MPI-PUGE-AT-0046c]